jgi:hypothetical protein
LDALSQLCRPYQLLQSSKFVFKPEMKPGTGVPCTPPAACAALNAMTHMWPPTRNSLENVLHQAPGAASAPSERYNPACGASWATHSTVRRLNRACPCDGARPGSRGFGSAVRGRPYLMQGSKTAQWMTQGSFTQMQARRIHWECQIMGRGPPCVGLRGGRVTRAARSGSVVPRRHPCLCGPSQALEFAA